MLRSRVIEALWTYLPWRGGRRRLYGATDPETGLGRMPAFMASAEEELARAARFRRPLSLLALAVVPDAAPSRAALQRFATTLRRHTRGFDLIGRADDGCFLVLLPEAGPAEAAAVMERILAEARECLGVPRRGAASINPVQVASAAFPDDGLLLRELLACARAGLEGGPAPAPAAAGDERLDDRQLRRFVAVVAAIGLGVLAAALLHLTPAVVVRLLPLLALALLAERFTNLNLGKTGVSLTAIVVMAASALDGPAAGAVAGCVSGLAAWHWRRYPPIKGAFNIGMLTLTAAVAGLPYWLLGGLPALSPHPATLLPGVAAGLIYVAINFGLLAMVLALATKTSWLRQWRLQCNWQIGHYAVMGAISLGLAVLYQAYGLTGLLLLLGPVWMLFHAQSQYVSHTADHVAELSTLNKDLTDSNERLQGANERLELTLDDLRRANESLLTALSEALELRDQETEGHSRRVVWYAQTMALALGLGPGEIQTVVHGALLHDIGKIGVPDAILLKPGALTPDEWAQMKLHPEIGYHMIAPIPFLAPAAQLVRHHHERWDGRGYPDNLAGEDIPLGARIFAVADSFDAMTSDRPYRRALTVEQAIAELERNSGTQFDPLIAATFCRLLTSGALGGAPAEEAAPPPSAVDRPAGAGGAPQLIRSAAAH